MVTSRTPLLLLVLLSCGNPEVRPPPGGVSGVLLEVRSDSARRIEARERTNQILQYQKGEQVLLHDLGRPLADFQLRPGPVSLGGPRRLAPVASYLYDGVWSDIAASRDLTVAVFDPTLCPQCIDSIACPACLESSGLTPICTTCSAPDFQPQPPNLSFDCPDGWMGDVNVEGVRWCTPPLPGTAEMECPANERFDWPDGCIAVNADCEEPQPRPGRAFRYVQPGAAAGGDGSRASPLATIERLPDTDFLVLAGDLTGPFALADGVGIIGSGRCTRLVAPGDDVALRTSQRAYVSRLRIEPASPSRAVEASLVSSTTSITIDRVELHGGNGNALRLTGDGAVKGSLISSNIACGESGCTDFTLISNGGHLEIVDTDFVAAVGLQKNGGSISITRVRVLGDKSDFSRALGVLNATPVVLSDVLVSGSHLRGVSVSITRTSTDSLLRLDNVHVSGRAQTPQEEYEDNRSVGIRLASHPEVPTRVVVQNSSTRGYEFGLQTVAMPLELQNFGTQQVLQGVHANINGLLETQLSFTDLWIEYGGRDGINVVSGNGVDLTVERAVITKDCSQSECPPPPVDSNHAPIAVSFYRTSSVLTAKQVFLHPGNGHASVGFEALTLEDVLIDSPKHELFFSALDFGFFTHNLNRVRLRNLQGAPFRWFDQATLQDVHIDGLAPLVCMLGPANGVARDILLRASGEQPVIVVADDDEGLNRPRFERGRIEHQGQVLGGSIDQGCEVIDTRRDATVLSDIEVVDVR